MISPERIIDYLRVEAGRPLKARELAQGLDIPESALEAFEELLGQLERDGLLYRVRRQRYAAPDKINLAVGRIQLIRSGAGFVVRENGEPDVFVPPESLGSAMHGDRVVARIEGRQRGDRPTGRVIRVLERARSTIVGVYHPARNFGFVTPEDRRLKRDVFVPPGLEAGAADGDMVVVRITNWGDSHKGPVGDVEQVLGPLAGPGVDILAVAYGHELPLEFGAAVTTEAERVRAAGIPASELARRLDLREQLVFTIDPADAKDHDDALSIVAAEHGGWQVGIHIADVSHFVQEGTLVDAEAMQRATSVYLVDRTIPMLPEALSNDLCSLVPDQDRLAISVLLRLSDDGRVLEERVARTVIRCGARLSYEDAQGIIDAKRSIAPDLDEAIRRLQSLAERLRQARAERGSIDFDLPAARVILGQEGEPVDIQRVTRLEAHRLIEDFMLLANETIARLAVDHSAPLVFRIHEGPSTDRVEQLRQFLASLGLRLGVHGTPKPKDFQRVLTQASGRPEEALISTVILRSMKRARYSAENLGHFGLAADFYTHFTSPIRRYPDLVVHRLITRRFIDGEQLSSDNDIEQRDEVARHSSEREQVATEAERDSIELKKVEFMERHLGDDFEGTISGVTSFGLFVLLDRFFVEGLVHVSSLDDDYYVFIEEQYSLLGENTRRRFRLGDRVQVRVAAVNLEERKIDFELLAEGGKRGRRPAKSFDRARGRP
ncbi:MAG: ribonuclease R [Longimicrobiales bacterium]